MARVLVLGGGGFIGSNLCESLLENDHQVRILERPNLQMLWSLETFEKIEVFPGDLTNTEEVGIALRGQDTVYHLVSTTLPKSSNDNPVYDVQSNVVGTINFLEIARKAGVRQVIFVSSGGTVYGIPQQLPIPETHPTDPICSYGITKLTIEKYLALFSQLHGLRYTVLRISNPYGRYQRTDSGQGAISVFLNRAMLGQPIEIWGDGSVVRDYIHISDVTSAMVSFLSYNGGETIFNLGSGMGHSLNQIVEAIGKATGRNVEVIFYPARSFDVPANVLDISRIKAALAWRPRVPLGDGIARTIDWLTQHRFSKVELRADRTTL
jgi:UDP-glucose 4-epimerase